jgi:hypothetical protein
MYYHNIFTIFSLFLFQNFNFFFSFNFGCLHFSVYGGGGIWPWPGLTFDHGRRAVPQDRARIRVREFLPGVSGPTGRLRRGERGIVAVPRGSDPFGQQA